MFNKLPAVRYPYTGGIELAGLVLSNLPSRLNIDRSFIIDRKIVSDGETPDMVAWRLYKNPGLHWTLLYLNSIRDPYTEWPMRDAFIEKYASLKYGVNALTQIKYLRYLDTGEEVVPEVAAPIIGAGAPYPLNITPVSFYQHEKEENDRRRSIIAVNPQYVLDFVDLYDDLIRGKR